MKNVLMLMLMTTLFVACTDKKQNAEATEETSVEVVDSAAVDSTTVEAPATEVVSEEAPVQE